MREGGLYCSPIPAPAWILCALGFFLFVFSHRRAWGAGSRYVPPQAPSAEPACQLPSASRNQFAAASLQARGVRLVVDESGALRFPHSLVDPACPRYVTALQDQSAGIGHRSREWATSLWLALAFNLTLVHHPVDFSLPGARHEHEGYQGWDAFLGLAFGESPEHFLGDLDVVGVGTAKQLLPSIGSWGAPTAQVHALWAPHLTAPACNVMFVTPGDEVPRDVSALVRPFMTWKFAAAAAARARAGVHLPLRYSPSAVNVAVHYRVGDIEPTPESALWAEARLALESLRAEGVEGALHVHVHTDGPVPLAHFGHLPLLEGEAEGSEVEVQHHPDMSANETMWHFVNADVFVGSRSGFSWLAGLLSPRSLAMLQRGGKWHETCADAGTAVCCSDSGACEEGSDALLQRAAQRIAAAQGCGGLGPRTAALHEPWPLEPPHAAR